MQNQPPYNPGGALSTGHYEFTNDENAMIAATGARAKLWGVISLVTGVLALVGLIVSLLFKDELIDHGLEPNYVTVFVVALVPIVLTHLVISMLYVASGKSLQAVVHTQGNDVEHLMQSLDKLGTAFLVEFAIGMLAVVVSFGIGVQMAIESVANEKAAEIARAAARAEEIDAAAEEEEGDTDTDGEDAEDEDAEGEDAEDEDAEGESDTDAEPAGDTDEGGGSGGEDGEDGPDGGAAAPEGDAPAEPDAPEIIEEPAAG